MSKTNNNSRAGSNSGHVIVVNFKDKEIVSHLINESDKKVLSYLADLGMSPLAIKPTKLSVDAYENVLRFHQKVA